MRFEEFTLINEELTLSLNSMTTRKFLISVFLSTCVLMVAGIILKIVILG